MVRTFRFRLTAWYLGLFAVLLASFSIFIYTLLARSLLARLDDKLNAQANTAVTLLADEIREEQGDLAKAATETVDDMRLPPGDLAILRDGLLLAGATGNRSRTASRDLEADGHKLRVIASQPLEIVDSDLRLVRRVILIALPVFLLLASAGGYLLVTRNLAPLNSMAAQARRIGDTNLHTRLEIGTAAEELELLAASFNELLGRLDRSFDSMRRFVADASHELRTPLSIIRGEADVCLSRERTPAEYRETLAVILDESRRLSRLVDDLLNLARADAGAVQLRIDDFDFGELLAECCRSAQILAAQRNVVIECRPQAEVRFSGDEALLRRLIVNLLDNAIRYTPAGGTVTASIEARAGGVILRVSDTGIGIPPDAAAHIFERFFRADKARSRAEGGCGLGLSIVKWIAESHRGAIDVESRPDAGATFTVRLPQ